MSVCVCVCIYIDNSPSGLECGRDRLAVGGRRYTVQTFKCILIDFPLFL